LTLCVTMLYLYITKQTLKAMKYPSSHRIEQNGNKVTLFSNATGKELLTLTDPKWNGTGNLLTYMVRVYVASLQLGNKFNVTQY